MSYNRRDARLASGRDPDQFANRVFFTPYPMAYDRWRNSRARIEIAAYYAACYMELRNDILDYRATSGVSADEQRRVVAPRLRDLGRPGDDGRAPGRGRSDLRASWVVADHAELFVRVLNVTDETYAVAAFTGYGPIPWTANPGEYRGLYAGVKAGLW